MAERKAVNKYYPPEWRPEKGGINKFRGTHALRERARKLHMGILIIRFEMPYNIWCEGCNNHIGMGVRYNAEKSKVGMYYSTPIYKFRMKCHLCDNHFEIQTDPKNLDYIILSGARRQERRWDPKDNDQVAAEESEISKKLATDAMYKLEHGKNDEKTKKQIAPTIAHLEEFQERWKNDYELNKILRKNFREKKKELKAAEEVDKTLQTKYSLNIPLVPENKDDVRLAVLLKLMPTESAEDKEKQKRIKFENSSVFNKEPNNTSEHINNLISSVQQKKLQTLSKPLTAKEVGIVKKNNSSQKTLCKDDTSALDKSAHGLLVCNDYGESDSE